MKQRDRRNQASRNHRAREGVFQCLLGITGKILKKRLHTSCVTLMRATHVASGRDAQPLEAAGNPWRMDAAQASRESWDRFARIRTETHR